ncbi:MAG: hypothetical protein AMXMBFR84_16610 [Candidatus Hydrogenedentota bacterium]
MPRRITFTLSKREVFLVHIQSGATIEMAAKAVGISRQAAYDLKRKCERFSQDWDEAYEVGTEAMEAEAYRRAVHGVKKPIWRGKKIVDYYTKYSDSLLIFLLKARKPSMYRESYKQKLDAVGSGIIRMGMSEEDLANAGHEESRGTPNVK